MCVRMRARVFWSVYVCANSHTHYTTNTERPAARHQHAMIQIGDTALMFGGKTGDLKYNDLWELIPSGVCEGVWCICECVRAGVCLHAQRSLGVASGVLACVWYTRECVFEGVCLRLCVSRPLFLFRTPPHTHNTYGCRVSPLTEEIRLKIFGSPD